MQNEVSGSNPSILVVDDEPSIRYTLEKVLGREGYQVRSAPNGAAAIEIFKPGAFDLVITDLTMPGMSGMELMKNLLKHDPECLVIIITAYGSEAIAVDAMKSGAYDYLPKPFANDDLKLTVSRALEKSSLRRENRALKQKLSGRTGLGAIIGNSEGMLHVFDLIEKVAPIDVTVLITGESGTGKELVASAINSLSPRKDAPYIRVNCAALPDNLIESELFGFEKGAFTGAVQRKLGKFELANNGTIFLDEIGDMALTTQTKILRILQEKEFERLGGQSVIKVDTRVIAATNNNLAESISQGEFREDLYYRLNVVNIKLPPLRERVGDIPALVEFFSEKFCEKTKTKSRTFSDSFINKLMQYSWPGNIRELQNLIERVIILDDEDAFPAGSGQLGIKGGLQNSRFINESLMNMPYKEAKELLLTSFEREFFHNLLERTDNNMSKAARIAQMHRKNLYLKLKDLGFNLKEP